MRLEKFGETLTGGPKYPCWVTSDEDLISQRNVGNLQRCKPVTAA